jgi:CHAT domain-containing protein
MRDIQDAQLMRDRARIELAAESAKPAEQREAGREDLLAKEALAAGTRTDELLAKLQSSFPDYSRFADPGPAGLGELQQGLGPDEAFLTFLVGAQTSYALLVTPSALTVEHLDLDESSLNADVAELRSAMVPRLGATLDFDMKASYELYHKLIGPLEDRLQRVAHLIVAPSGALASLPLALLVTAAPREGALKSYSEAAWLVRQTALSQVPSARAFLALRAAAEHRAPAAKTFLGIGDPSFDGVAAGANGAKALNALNTNCREAGPISPDLIRALPPLRETADEVRTVGHLLGGEDTLLLGKDATERNFRARPLDQYAVLYFATHGLLPGELHCQTEPGLVLSPPATPARSTDEDGLLDASEIAGLKLNADLVVLSACNTAASGGQFGGDALSGLADAFFNAGARTVLASHWEVPSLATVKLMTGLFAALGPQRTRGLAQSLRQAQLALIAQPATAHPFNWAAFAVIGDGAAPSRTADAPPAADEPARGRT